jgi:glycosyltransferase involved in cell wall biosynthesis
VDTKRFHPGVDGVHIRSKCGLGDNYVVGFAGSLKSWHGVGVLVSAWMQAAKPGWSLLLVGEGPELARLATQAAQPGHRGRVVFTGAISHDEMPEYVAAMDVAVAPYRSIPGFYFSPLKLYEYLAMGKAVVASGIGQVRKVVRHGENGLLVPPGDADALGAALSLLGGDPALRASLAGRAPHELVSWEAVARDMVTVAQAVAGNTVNA